LLIYLCSCLDEKSNLLSYLFGGFFIIYELDQLFIELKKHSHIKMAVGKWKCDIPFCRKLFLIDFWSKTFWMSTGNVTLWINKSESKGEFCLIQKLLWILSNVLYQIEYLFQIKHESRKNKLKENPLSIHKENCSQIVAKSFYCTLEALMVSH